MATDWGKGERTRRRTQCLAPCPLHCTCVTRRTQKKRRNSVVLKRKGFCCWQFSDMNFYFIFSLVPWRFWIIYILIIFTTLPWFFLDPRSLPNYPAPGPLSFCNPWSTVFTGHILVDVCPSTRTWSMFGAYVRKEAQLPLSLQLLTGCSVTGETLCPLPPRWCLSDWALHRSGASNQSLLSAYVSCRVRKTTVSRSHPHLHICQSFYPLVCREPWALVGEGCGVAVSFTGWAFCSLIICILTMHGSLLTLTYCKRWGWGWEDVPYLREWWFWVSLILYLHLAE